MKIFYISIAVLLILLLAGGGYFYFNHLRPIKGMAPTGHYKVGTTSFDYEFGSAITGRLRKLNVKAWYPTHSIDGARDVMQSEETALAVVKIFNLPEFLATSDKSHSYTEAPIATDEALYPVIIFNHGFASFPTQNTVQMQNLASHGYIVLSMAHPGISLVTEYTDGTSMVYDGQHPAYIAFHQQVADLEGAGQAFDGFLQNVNIDGDFEAFWQDFDQIRQSPLYIGLQPVFKQWIEDSNSLVDAIANGQGSVLSPAIGTYMSRGKIGIFGHSLGGVTASFSSMSNGNIVASLNLDAPPLFSVDIKQLNFNKPSCYLMSDIVNMGGKLLDLRRTNVPLLQKSSAFGCNAIYKGAAHMSFTDMNYVGVMKLAGQLGKVDQQKMGEEVNQMILWFFDKSLKDSDADYQPRHGDIVDVEYFNQ